MVTATVCSMVVMVIELVLLLLLFIAKIKHDHNSHLFLVVLPGTDIYPLEMKVS